MSKYHYYVLLAAVTPVCALSAPVPSNITKQVEQSVMLVQAKSCNGNTPARNGSGFAWLDAKHVVTAWHVVGGAAASSSGMKMPQDSRSRLPNWRGC